MTPPHLGRWLLLQGLLVTLGLISLSWNLVAIVLYPVLPRASGLRIGRAGIAYGYRLFWTVARACGLLTMDTQALDSLSQERGLILVANHPSLLDALMIVARLPRCNCIMKASLTGNVFLGAGARLARYIRNHSSIDLVRSAVADLKSGGQLLMFPEGTRTTSPPVNTFRPGVTLIAKLANTPIQTVIIDFPSPYLRKGWPLWKLPITPIVFSVRLGQRFSPQPDAEALLQTLETYFKNQVK